MNKIAQQLLEEGHITKEAAQRLEEFDTMLKEAGMLDMIKTTLFETAKKVGPTAVGTVLGVLGADYLTNRADQKRKEEELVHLQTSFGNIASKNKDISENRERAAQRFNEIAHFSPTVAKMPQIATPIIRRTMDKGLSETDVRHLIQIEAGQKQIESTPRPVPTSARLVRQLAPATIASMGDNLVKTFGDSQNRAEMKMEELKPERIGMVLKFLKEKGALPSELANLDFNDPSSAQVVGAYAQKNPDFLVQTIRNNPSLVEGYNEVMTRPGPKPMFKESSATVRIEDISLEKRAEILADQYIFSKKANIFGRLGGAIGKGAISKGDALLGLGAATLFGAGGALVEEAADYTRSSKMNEKIRNSWSDTQSRLKKMTKDENVLASGIDYSKKENINKAEEAFKVLVDVAPSLAANSTIATPFVNRVVMQGGDITPDVIKMVTETQKNINTSKQYRSPFADSPIASGFSRGFESAGGREFIKEIAKD